MTNRSAVAETFLSGERVLPGGANGGKAAVEKKSGGKPKPADLVPPRGEPAGSEDSAERLNGSQKSSPDEEAAPGAGPFSGSSHDNGSPFRVDPNSRRGPLSVTTQSTWDDRASSHHIPSPTEVRQRARARKAPRRRRHPPQRTAGSVVSRSDTSMSRSQAPWQGPPSSWGAPPPGWGGGWEGGGIAQPYPGGPGGGYGGPPPATAPAGMAARHTPGGWEGAFHQGGGNYQQQLQQQQQMWPPQQQYGQQQQQQWQQPQQQQWQQQHMGYTGGPPPQPNQQQNMMQAPLGGPWQQQQQPHPSLPQPQQQQQQPQRPELPAAVVAAEMQRLRDEMSAVRGPLTAGDSGGPNQAVSDDMLGRIDRIEGAMEQLLQRFSAIPAGASGGEPPAAAKQPQSLRLPPTGKRSK